MAAVSLGVDWSRTLSTITAMLIAKAIARRINLSILVVKSSELCRCLVFIVMSLFSFHSPPIIHAGIIAHRQDNFL